MFSLFTLLQLSTYDGIFESCVFVMRYEGERGRRGNMIVVRENPRSEHVSDHVSDHLEKDDAE